MVAMTQEVAARRGSAGSDAGAALGRMAACCAPAGALGGGYIGWLYGLDQALSPAGVPGYVLVGLLLGALFGMLMALPSGLLLLGLEQRGLAPAPVRVLLSALAGAASATFVLGMASGSSLTGREALLAALAGGLAAGLVATGLALPGRAGRRAGVEGRVGR